MPYGSIQKEKKIGVPSGNPQNPALLSEDKRDLNWLKEEPRNLESEPQQKQKEQAKEQEPMDPLEQRIKEITEELKALRKTEFAAARERLKYNLDLAHEKEKENFLEDKQKAEKYVAETEQKIAEVKENLEELKLEQRIKEITEELKALRKTEIAAAKERLKYNIHLAHEKDQENFLADKQKAEQYAAETEQKIAELKELKIILEIQKQQQEERKKVLEEIKKVLQESQTTEEEAKQERRQNIQMLTEKIDILRDLTGMLLTYKMTRDRTVYEKMAEVLTEAINEKQMADRVPEYKISRWHSSSEKERLINVYIEKINAVRFSLERERLELQENLLDPLAQGTGKAMEILDKATIAAAKKFRDCEQLKHPERYEEVLEQEKEKLSKIRLPLAEKRMQLDESRRNLHKEKRRLNQAEQRQTVQHQKELERAELEIQDITEQQKNLQEIVSLIKEYQETGKREVYKKKTVPLIKKLSDENLKEKLKKSGKVTEIYEKNRLLQEILEEIKWIEFKLLEQKILQKTKLREQKQWEMEILEKSLKSMEKRISAAQAEEKTEQQILDKIKATEEKVAEQKKELEEQKKRSEVDILSYEIPENTHSKRLDAAIQRKKQPVLAEERVIGSETEKVILREEEITATHSDVQRSALKRNLLQMSSMDLHASTKGAQGMKLSTKGNEALRLVQAYAQLDVVSVNTKLNTEDSQEELQKQSDDINLITQESDALIAARNALQKHMQTLQTKKDQTRTKEFPNVKYELRVIKQYLDYLNIECSGDLQIPEGAVVKDCTTIKLRDSQNNTIKDKDMKDMKNTPLFAHEPSIHDIVQGGLGDCYLLAGLASIVNKDPKIIKKCMRDNGKTVTVRFYKEEHGVMQPLYIEVSKTVPMELANEEKKIKVDKYARGALWVKMIEKAYAASGLHVNQDRLKAYTDLYETERPASYGDIEGGTPGAFIACMTGVKAKHAFSSYDHRNELEKDEAGENVVFSHKSEWPLTKYFLQWTSPKEKNGNLADGKSEYEGLKTFFGLQDEELKKGSKEEKLIGAYTKAIQKFFEEKIDEYKTRGMYQDKNRIQEIRFFGRMLSIEEITDAMKTVIKLLEDGKIRVAFDEQQKKEWNLTAADEEAWKQKTVVAFHTMMKLFEEGKYFETIAHYQAFSGKYTAQAVEKYYEIAAALKKGKFVTGGTTRFVPSGVHVEKGLNGESLSEGIVEGHAYSILGVEKIGKDRYIKLRNPWDKRIRRYIQKGNGSAGQRAERKDDKTHGIFLMEWNQFLQTFSHYEIN